MKDILLSLMVNGYHLESVNRIADGNSIINFFKYDKLGAKINYSLLFSENKGNTTLVDTLFTTSEAQRSTPIIVSDFLSTERCLSLNLSRFYDSIGGLLNTGLVLLSQLDDILNSLGHNKLPDGLTGKPDDLLEIYAKECLQFITFSPARRYGRDRLFESLPDGIVLGNGSIILQYDSKAYSRGFSISSDDILRFAKYINEFNQRYGQLLGRVYAFLVISGQFNDELESLQKRSDKLYEMCNTHLTCLTCSGLGEIVKLIVKNNDKRSLINWKEIFSNRLITKDDILKDIQRIDKDGLL
jgi:hypothetical protein